MLLNRALPLLGVVGPEFLGLGPGGADGGLAQRQVGGLQVAFQVDFRKVEGRSDVLKPPVGLVLRQQFAQAALHPEQVPERIQILRPAQTPTHRPALPLLSGQADPVELCAEGLKKPRGQCRGGAGLFLGRHLPVRDLVEHLGPLLEVVPGLQVQRQPG